MVSQLHRQQPNNTSSSNYARAQEHWSSTAKGDMTTGCKGPYNTFCSFHNDNGSRSSSSWMPEI